MWLKIIVLTLVALAVCVTGVILYGTLSWNGKIRDLRARLEAARLSIEPATFDPSEIESLPPPVQKYFRAVLKEGQPLIAVARFSPEGQFRTKESDESWKPFTSTQTVVTRRPGFVWDARIRMAAGVRAFVYDAYVAGAGMLHAEAFGLISVADVSGTPAAAQGELLRYLAEALWYPTALLPSQGVRWEAIDDSSAKVTLTDGSTTVSMVAHFDVDGLISSMSASSRYYGDVDGVPKFAPWRGRFRVYEERNGIRIPLEGEAVWDLPAGPLPYWRGRITDIGYEFAH
jgi:hypothetical protein